MSRREIAREVAVVSQTPDPSLPLTVRDTVASVDCRTGPSWDTGTLQIATSSKRP